MHNTTQCTPLWPTNKGSKVKPFLIALSSLRNSCDHNPSSRLPQLAVPRIGHRKACLLASCYAPVTWLRALADEFAILICKHFEQNLVYVLHAWHNARNPWAPIPLPLSSDPTGEEKACSQLLYDQKTSDTKCPTCLRTNLNGSEWRRFGKRCPLSVAHGSEWHTNNFECATAIWTANSWLKMGGGGSYETNLRKERKGRQNRRVTGILVASGKVRASSPCNDAHSANIRTAEGASTSSALKNCLIWLFCFKEVFNIAFCLSNNKLILNKTT